MLSMTSMSFAQSSFTYSFDAANGSAWPSDWSGASFADEAHHSNGWGFDNPSSATDDFTGAYVGAQNVNVTGAKYFNGGSFDVNKSSLNYTMSWNPNGQKGLQDTGSSAGNQIFQIGVFSSAPTVGSSQFGTNLGSSVAGHDSFYLAGVELSGSGITQMGSLDLKYFDENSVELANFGTLNYTAVDVAGTHLFNFRQDLVDLGRGGFQVTLTMDEYVVNPSAGTTTYIGQTSFGTQSFTHGLNSLSTLTPGLGFRVQDFAAVSVTAANYDGAVPVNVPEPSGAHVALLSSSSVTPASASASAL